MKKILKFLLSLSIFAGFYTMIESLSMMEPLRMGEYSTAMWWLFAGYTTLSILISLWVTFEKWEVLEEPNI